jgi:hypothetical protein
MKVAFFTFIVCILSTGVGHARHLSWPNYRPAWNDYALFRPEHKHAHSGPVLPKTKQAHSTPVVPKTKQSSSMGKGQIQIIISIADQRISVYENDALLARSSVSTGIPAHPTPLGIFSIIAKQRWHRSNIYSAAPMPYMQRITWSGIALHAGELPGHPASHGCIRLRYGFAVQLWHLTKRGTRVIIAQSDLKPIAVNSPRLFRPKPIVASGPTATVGNDDADAKREVLKTDAQLTQPNLGNREPNDIQSPGGAERRKRQQISIFVSRKEGKLYVRQGFVPLFDTPISIREPERPLGTHVFTAMAFNSEDPAVLWTVMSLPEKHSHDIKHKKTVRSMPIESDMKPASLVRTPENALAALDRIEIPKGTFDKISELLSPGSSLMLSDEGISSETGPDTDFIVLAPK